MNYRAAYWIGFHPWEDAARDPPFVAKVAELFEREEEGRQPPCGSALDIGTGSGIWGAGAYAFKAVGRPNLAIGFATLVAVHYAWSYERVAWLLKP